MPPRRAPRRWAGVTTVQAAVTPRRAVTFGSNRNKAKGWKGGWGGKRRGTKMRGGEGEVRRSARRVGAARCYSILPGAAGARLPVADTRAAEVAMSSVLYALMAADIRVGAPSPTLPCNAVCEVQHAATGFTVSSPRAGCGNSAASSAGRVMHTTLGASQALATATKSESASFGGSTRDTAWTISVGLFDVCC